MYSQIQKKYVKVLYLKFNFNGRYLDFKSLNNRLYHCGKGGVYGYRQKLPSRFQRKILL